MTALVGTYNLAKANWYTVTEPGQGVDNLARWKLAHPGISIGPRSYNFNLTSPTTFVPTNDSTDQITAHNLGVAGSRAVTGGYDFLWKGNYVTTEYTVNDIGGIPIANGRLYYAGDTTNFDTPALTPPTRSPAIVRDWAEVITTSDLATLIPLVDGNSFTLNVQPTSTTAFGVTRFATGTAAANNNTAVTTPTFSVLNGDYISVGVGTITTASGVATITWNGNNLIAENSDSRGIGGGQTLTGVLYKHVAAANGTFGVSVTFNAGVSSYAIATVVIRGVSISEGNALGTNGTTTNMSATFANGCGTPAYIHSCAVVAKTYSESHGTVATGDATTEGQSDGTSNIWIAEAYSFKNTSPANWTWARSTVPTPTNWVFLRDQVD